MKIRLIPILTNYEKKFFLEIGCGIGRWSKIISKKNSVVGIDISRFMIKEAKKSRSNERFKFNPNFENQIKKKFTNKILDDQI